MVFISFSSHFFSTLSAYCIEVVPKRADIPLSPGIYFIEVVPNWPKKAKKKGIYFI